MAEIVYQPEARLEALDAADWYLARGGEELEDRFLSAWERTEQRVAADPELAPRTLAGCRRRLFEGFPHGLVYRIQEDGPVIVVAVAALRRRPGYWLERVAEPPSS